MYILKLLILTQMLQLHIKILNPKKADLAKLLLWCTRKFEVLNLYPHIVCLNVY